MSDAFVQSPRENSAAAELVAEVDPLDTLQCHQPLLMLNMQPGRAAQLDTSSKPCGLVERGEINTLEERGKAGDIVVEH